MISLTIVQARMELASLARACYEGACNARGIIKALNVITANDRDAVVTVEYKIIIAQLAFLCGEGLGPSDRVLKEFKEIYDIQTNINA